MTNLYVLLIALGVLIIAAVFAYNWWQERQFHQQVDKNFSPLQKDALLEDPAFHLGDLNDGFADTIIDDTSIKNKKIAATKSVSTTTPASTTNHAGNTLHENISISDAYSQLSTAGKAAQIHQSEKHVVSDSSKNPVPREDIKAIFDVAFGQTAKSTMTNQPKSIETEQVDLLKSGRIPNTSHKQAEDEPKKIGLPEMLHAQIDSTGLIHLPVVAPVSAIMHQFAGLFDGFDKPVFVHVLSIDQTGSQQWILLKDTVANQQVSKIACSIQLADRAGAISRNLLNRFNMAVESLAKHNNAQVEWQNTGDVLSDANALDIFCIEVDKTIGFHLVQGESGAFTGTKLKGLAESQGFILTSDGTFKYLVEGQMTFTMFNRDNFPFNAEMLRNSVIKGVTFQLDIPHVKQCIEAFNQMVLVSKQMEIGLHAVLVDDNNKVLGETQLEKIRQQLKAIQSTMLARDIIPGSSSALRLFS